MLIINATLITWEASNRILNDHAVYIKGAHIRVIGPAKDLIAKYPQEEKLDAHGLKKK